MTDLINSLLIMPGRSKVQSVDMSVIGITTWFFGSSIELTGANVPELEIDDGGGWQAATAVTQPAHNILSASFPTGAPGIAWRVLTLPVNINFHGKTFSVPQSGT